MKPNPDPMLVERDFNWRPFATSVVLLCVMFAWIAADNSEHAAQIEPRTEREMAIRNSARMDAMEREITDLQIWRDRHSSADTLNLTDAGARIRELEVKVEAHERILWFLIAAFVTSIVGLVFSFLQHRSTRSEVEEMVRKYEESR